MLLPNSRPLPHDGATQIGIIGNIGAGKTTATEILAHYLDAEPRYEPVANNPYLEDFYLDMPKWAFHLQVYFLTHRLENAINAKGSKKPITIIDRTVIEDKEIFALNLYRTGIMSERDWMSYLHIHETMAPHFHHPDLFVYLRASTEVLMSHITRTGIMSERDWMSYLHIHETMAPHFHHPDLFVYLRASTEVLMSHITKRGRECERDIPWDYINDLNLLYDTLATRLEAEGHTVLTVNMDALDLTAGGNVAVIFAEMVRDALRKVPAGKGMEYGRLL